jgi:hypothetical protein
MKIIPIKGGSITKLEDTMSIEECSIIKDYMIKNTNKDISSPDKMPWFEGNTLYYRHLPDKNLKNIIKQHRDLMIKTIEEVYGQKVYGHLTTIVLWKPGQSMSRHHDQGNKGEEKTFNMRTFTSVLYVNDDFEGGETFIRNDGVKDESWRSDPVKNYNDYTSTPKLGNAVLFYGDDRNAHGVNKVTKGNRITVSTWYTLDPNYEAE